MENNEIKKVLLHFLKTIYHYERTEISEYSLSFQEVYAMQYLKESGDKNIGEIADELNIKHFAASRLISRLEKKEYIEKIQKENDKRVFVVTIRPEGIRIIKLLEESHTRTILNNLEKNPDLDINAFIETAHNIHKILDVNKEGE